MCISRCGGRVASCKGHAFGGTMGHPADVDAVDVLHAGIWWDGDDGDRDGGNEKQVIEGMTMVRRRDLVVYGGRWKEGEER